MKTKSKPENESDNVFIYFDEQLFERTGITELQLFSLLIDYIGKVPGNLCFSLDEKVGADRLGIELPWGVGLEE
ncbi:MAG: hypothetical protein E7559_00225 [Ruminococcaceae bacterium]|nr:hypothetical protein [Oscillospiraceae bacterium]